MPVRQLAAIVVAAVLLLAAPASTALADGTTWSWGTTPAVDSQWNGVAYGRGVLVAVADTGTDRVMRSTDGGETWTGVNVPARDWIDVAYGDGKFVAVSFSGGYGMVSHDLGQTWTEYHHSSGQITNDWRNAITYGGGRFVAVGARFAGANIASSADGVNWTSATGSGTSALQDVAYGNGKFVAVGNDLALHSADGVAWTSSSPAIATGNWRTLTYGSGMFVAASLNNSTSITSADGGATWSATSAMTGDVKHGSAFGGGAFVVVGSRFGTGNVFRSTDGAAWSTVTTLGTVTTTWRSVVFANGRFVAVSEDHTAGSRAAYSGTLADTTGPVTTIDSGPAEGSFSPLSQPTFTYSATDPAGIWTYECRLDGGGWASCPGGSHQTAALSVGSHTLDVRAYDEHGNLGAAVSRSWTSMIAPANDALPAVSGTEREGATLTATTGAWTGTSLSHSRRWQREDGVGSWTDIAGATGATYTAAAADIGHRLRVTVTATNAVGTVTAASAPTDLVAADAPRLVRAPVLSGGPTSTALTVAPGAWSGTGVQTTIRWQRDDDSGTWTDVGTGDRYVVGDGDRGARLRAVVTASNAQLHGGTAVTAATSTVPLPRAAPRLVPTGDGTATVAPGTPLTVDPGTWAEGVSISVVWQRLADGAWHTVDGASGFAFTPTGAGLYRALLRVEDNGATEDIELRTVTVAGLPAPAVTEPVTVRISDAQLVPERVLTPAAARVRRAAMLRACGRRSRTAASRKACRAGVAARLTPSLEWRQSAPAQVRYALVRGTRTLAEGVVAGDAGTNRLVLPPETRAKLVRPGRYRVRLWVDTQPPDLLRLPVLPSVQGVRAPGDASRRAIEWWQDTPGRTTLTISRRGSTILRWTLDGRPGRNRHELSPSAVRRLTPGRYDLEAWTRVGRLRSAPSWVVLTVRP